jgi:hypothetical protein
MAWKHHDEMTVEEARQEMHHLEGYFASCAEIGQGINTKESVRHRGCKAMVTLHDELGVKPSSYQSLEGGVLGFTLWGYDPDNGQGAAEAAING